MENETINYEKIDNYIKFLEKKYENYFEGKYFILIDEDDNDDISINYFDFMKDFNDEINDNFLVEFQDEDLIQDFLLSNFEEKEVEINDNYEFINGDGDKIDYEVVDFNDILIIISFDLRNKY